MWVPFLIQAHKSWRGYCGMEVEKRHRQECAKHYVRTVSSSVISFDRHEFGVRFLRVPLFKAVAFWLPSSLKGD
jgi:hypothetical protein